MFLKLDSSDGYASKSQMLHGTLVRSLSTVHEVVLSSVLKVVNRCTVVCGGFDALISKGQTAGVSVYTTRLQVWEDAFVHTADGSSWEQLYTQLYLNVKCV